MGAIAGVIITPLKIIEVPNGNVMHGMKNTDAGFEGFGEAYFSTVNHKAVKGWKKHTQMTLNLVVPIGEVKFVMMDDRIYSETMGNIYEVVVGTNNYARLTVPPGIWMAFQGKAEGLNMLLNLASILHDPSEAEALPLENSIIDYKF
jgi:dTDP-4-dehydrorhamnose 3,5-epimerase